ncbi:YceI-like domain-containing protein [Epilithonimonas mollis]|uniref:YceI-like domain-containing protein n=2 Tax=Epilithonimonas mollis TaxID=216903 RepID=A0A1M6NP64_9FLAO|nr:YceI-like domain-containing protein [Epilithonimonas mollis]
MKTMKNLIKLTLAIGTLGFAQLSNAQKLSIQSSNIKIDGTSTLHDWNMTSTQATFSGNASGTTINDVKFVLKTTSLKSKETAMDKNAYKSLEASKYPDITFTTASLPTSGTATISGNLTITDATKNIKFPVTVTKNGNSYIIKGSTKLKMSAFGIKPPSFMMGTIKTGDEITININISATN